MAGARALLVSHWAVNSEATVALITGAFAELETSAKLGRAEALRRSLLAMIDKGLIKNAHPTLSGRLSSSSAKAVREGSPGAGNIASDRAKRCSASANRILPLPFARALGT